MQEETSNKKKREFLPALEPAYSILEKISDQLESAGEDQQKLQASLEISLTDYDQAKVIFLAEKPTLAGCLGRPPKINSALQAGRRRKLHGSRSASSYSVGVGQRRP